MDTPQEKTGLQALLDKYQTSPAQLAAKKAERVFDASSVSVVNNEKRLGYAPGSAAQTETGRIHQDYAQLQSDLAQLADKYGKLNVNFRTLMGPGKMYSFAEGLMISLYSLTGQDKKATDMKTKIAGARGDALEKLVDALAEVIEEQHEKAKEGRYRLGGLLTQTVAELQRLDRKIIENLKQSHYTSADEAVIQVEIERFSAELNEINGYLQQYEADITNARNARDTDRVQQLAKEMGQVLDLKYEVLNTKLASQGAASEIRRQLLDRAEGVQSAKGAIAAAHVNYQALNALVDSFTELEIKYKHAREDMIPVFKMQATIGVMGQQGYQLGSTILEMAEQSERLMALNSRMVQDLGKKTFALLQTPVYDPQKAYEIEGELAAFQKELNAQRIEWAQKVSTVTDNINQPHYSQDR